MKERFALLWIDDDQPLIIRNPPSNLDDLIRQWASIDPTNPDWIEVDPWLRQKGIEIFRPNEEMRLALITSALPNAE